MEPRGGSPSKGKVCKATDRGMKISEIMLLKKSGGEVGLIFDRSIDPMGKEAT
jgi:hypothetical protein